MDTCPGLQVLGIEAASDRRSAIDDHQAAGVPRQVPGNGDHAADGVRGTVLLVVYVHHRPSAWIASPSSIRLPS